MDPVEDLSHQLWTIRELLDELVYKLEVQRLLLAAGSTRWLSNAASELQAVIDAIGEVDTVRAEAQHAVAERLQIDPESTLQELITHLDEGQAIAMRAHRVHLLSLQEEVAEASRSNQELARRGLARTQDLAASLGTGSVDAYDPVGQARSLSLASQRLDRTV